MPLRRFLASLAFACLVLLAQGAAAERFRVLVVMSYEQDNPWVREIREGIDGVLGAHADDLKGAQHDVRPVVPDGAAVRNADGEPVRLVHGVESRHL